MKSFQFSWFVKLGIVLVFLLIAVPALANTISANCNTYISTTIQTCSNYLKIQDDLASADHRMTDHHRATSAYNILFSQTSWYPTVRRGEPVYSTYWIFDKQNNITAYQNSSWVGKYLNDYPGGIGIGIGRNVGYYPGKSPTSVLELRNAALGRCTPLLCIKYYQQNTYFIK